MSIDLFLSIFLHMPSLHLPVMCNGPSTQASISEFCIQGFEGK